jgi:Pyruvate/2-oxoacid:ferredoxin oxidoreductase delta subunit
MPRHIAVIREEDCVGCGKCLAPCPVDAIIGSEKFLHVVLTDECIGCGLCVAPCPMDCIEMIEENAVLELQQALDKHQFNKQQLDKFQHGKQPVEKQQLDKQQINKQQVDKERRAAKAKKRYIAKTKRTLKEQHPRLSFLDNDPNYQNKIRSELLAAVSRVTIKKENLSPPNPPNPPLKKGGSVEYR